MEYPLSHLYTRGGIGLVATDNQHLPIAHYLVRCGRGCSVGLRVVDRRSVGLDIKLLPIGIALVVGYRLSRHIDRNCTIDIVECLGCYSRRCGRKDSDFLCDILCARKCWK